jgi:hypothetical protein
MALDLNGTHYNKVQWFSGWYDRLSEQHGRRTIESKPTYDVT